MSKIQDLKQKNPNYVIDLIDDLSKRDPSNSNKYLPFMVAACEDHVREYFNESFVQLLTLVKDFEKYCSLNLIANKDIYSYRTKGQSMEEYLKAVETVVTEAKSKNTNREIKINETIVLYEDKEKILVKCLSKASAELYGKNTEWCTSAKRNNRFNEYTKEGVLLYFTYKDPPTSLPAEWRKLAFNRKSPNEERTVWNAKSAVVSTFDAMRLFSYVGERIMEIVIRECDLCIPNLSITREPNGKYIVNNNIFKSESTISSAFHKQQEDAVRIYVTELKDCRDSHRSAIDTIPVEAEQPTIDDVDLEAMPTDEGIEEAIESEEAEEQSNEPTALVDGQRRAVQQDGTLSKYLAPGVYVSEGLTQPQREIEREVLVKNEENGGWKKNSTLSAIKTENLPTPTDEQKIRRVQSLISEIRAEVGDSSGELS
jgi:hypothetical protein